jgi:hypothetical protein
LSACGRSLCLGAVLWSVSACATGTPTTSTSGEAVQGRGAKQGPEVLVHVRSTGTTVYYNNNPDPLCFRFEVAGKWTFAQSPQAIRSSSGRSSIRVMFVPMTGRDGPDGDVVSRVADELTRDFERSLGRPLRTTLETGDARWPTARWWRSDWIEIGGRKARPSPRLLMPLATGHLVIVTVDAEDYRQLGHAVLASLETVTTRDCYVPTLRRRYPEVLK